MTFLGRGKHQPSTGQRKTEPESLNVRNRPRDRAPSMQRVAGESSDEDASPLSQTPLRVMTYNIHQCIGLDGKCRPERIADIIDDLDPDLVALQEIDVNRPRSGGQDQAHIIASHLGMQHHFFPVWSARDEKYGLAVLSKRPLTVIREALLTEACPRTKREARGAIWVSVDTGNGQPVHFLNLHLGLSARERLLQIDALLGEGWLCNRFSSEPVIVAGDLNAGPGSQVMKRLQKHLACVQLRAVEHRPVRTFASVFPLRRIDHILVSQHFHVAKVSVQRNHFTVVASDHLPLCADLLLQFENPPSLEKTSTSDDQRSENDQHAIPCVRHRL
jgi:endonuclease/exonuclease/phosphatase family metal-dependent hydrolase